MPESKKGRYSYISFAKALGITGITLYHCLVFFLGSPFVPLQAEHSSEFVKFVNPFFDGLFVPGFIFCSGFLFAKGAYSGKRSYGKTIWERLTRLLVPYYIVGTIWLVPMYTIFDIPCFGRPEHAGFLEGYKTMALGQFSDHLWFLWGLFWTSLIFCLILPLCRKPKLHPYVFVIITAVSVLEHYFVTGIPYFKLFSADSYNWVFFAGMVCYFYRYHFFVEKRSNVWVVFGVNVILFNALIFFSKTPLYERYSQYLFALSWLKYASGGFCIFLTAVLLERHALMEKIFRTKFWDYTYRHNLLLYLFNLPLPHLFFILFYQKLSLPAWATILLVTVCTFPSLYLLVGIVGKLQNLAEKAFRHIVSPKKTKP